MMHIWKSHKVALENAAGAAGYACYRYSAAKAGYTFKCKDPRPMPDACYHMQFQYRQ